MRLLKAIFAVVVLIAAVLLLLYCGFLLTVASSDFMTLDDKALAPLDQKLIARAFFIFIGIPCGVVSLLLFGLGARLVMSLRRR